MATNSLAGEAVGEVFELIIDKLANLHDGVIQGRNGRGGEHDGHDALEILLDIITKLGDLLVAVGFGEEEILHFVGAEGFVGEDVDFCQFIGDSINGTERDDSVFGGRVAVGVNFERISPVNTISDGDGEKDSGVAGEFYERISRGKEKQMTIIGLFEFHDTRFEFVLMLLKRIASS